MGAAACLNVDDVHVWRGERHVLQGVGLTLHAGGSMHVTGPNGTGKTTLLRVATGLLRPDGGTVRWRGVEIGECALDYQREFSFASHEPALKGDLTVLENLRFAVGIKRRTSQTELRECLELTGVAECAGLPARALSAGQRRRVALACIVAARTLLWLLDEPYTNLDAAGSVLMSALLQRHLDDGGMLLIVAHHELALRAPVPRLELRG